MILFKAEELTDSVIKFNAVEDGEKYGFCLMKIYENTADVYELEYSADKPYTVEGLLRSAYNFASLRNIYMGKCSCKNIDIFLERMSFEKRDGCYINDIPTILTGSCCKQP